MEIRKFGQFKRSEMINEEFIFGMLKGALGKLFNLFAAPFKDLANDIKKMFKEDDLGTIKDIILTNLDQAIDAAQKEIPKLTDEGALTDLMPKMVEQLANLAINIEKEVTVGLGKDKAPAFATAAKAVLLGNKEAKWAGIVGYLDPTNAAALKNNGGLKITNFKYNKAAYDKALTDAGAKGGIKQKKVAASKFFDDLQNYLDDYIEKELTDEELKKIYNDSGGQSVGGEEEEALLKSYGSSKKEDMVGKEVRYKMKKYDANKKPEEQKQNIGKLKVLSVKDDGLELDGKDADFVKKMSDILPAEGSGENAKKAAEIIGKFKEDEEKMGKVAKFAEFIQDDKNKDKVVEIDAILQGGQGQSQE